MQNYVIIDNKMRKEEKQKLKQLNYEIIEIPTNKNIYYEISSHVDIFCTSIKNNVVVEKSVYDKLFFSKKIAKSILVGDKIVGAKYPYDILYNVCVIGNCAIHNFKYTDKVVLDLIKKYNLKMIDIKQGYSKCSIAVIDENSAIVSDKKIADELVKNNIDTLVVNDKLNIKLLDKDGKYSKMYGFIGGSISRLDNMIFVSGDLKKIDEDNKIRNFIEKRGLEIVDFKNMEVVDYGGILRL